MRRNVGKDGTGRGGAGREARRGEGTRQLDGKSECKQKRGGVNTSRKGAKRRNKKNSEG